MNVRWRLGYPYRIVAKVFGERNASIAAARIVVTVVRVEDWYPLAKLAIMSHGVVSLAGVITAISGKPD